MVYGGFLTLTYSHLHHYWHFPTMVEFCHGGNMLGNHNNHHNHRDHDDNDDHHPGLLLPSGSNTADQQWLSREDQDWKQKTNKLFQTKARKFNFIKCICPNAPICPKNISSYSSFDAAYFVFWAWILRYILSSSVSILSTYLENYHGRYHHHHLDHHQHHHLDNHHHHHHHHHHQRQHHNLHHHHLFTTIIITTFSPPCSFSLIIALCELQQWSPPCFLPQAIHSTMALQCEEEKTNGTAAVRNRCTVKKWNQWETVAMQWRAIPRHFTSSPTAEKWKICI